MKNQLFSDKHVVVISPKSIMFLVLFVLLLLFLFSIRSILILTFISFIIMVGLQPIVQLFRTKLKLPKTLSIFISYLIFILLISLLVAVIIPPFVSQTQQLLGFIELPLIEDQLRALQHELKDVSTGLRTLTLNDISQWRDYAGRVSESVGVLFTILSTAFNGVFILLTVFVMSFYLMLEKDQLHKKVIWFSKEQKHMDMVQRFIDEIQVELGGWVRGQLLLMFVVGLITYVGLTMLSIPYALPLALLAGLLEIVPNIGPTLAAVPAVFIAYLTFGWGMALIVILFSIVVQQLENNLLVPRIIGRSANVNPFVALLVILTGFKVGGALGALLGIPVYIIVRKLYSLTLKP